MAINFASDYTEWLLKRFKRQELLPKLFEVPTMQDALPSPPNAKLDEPRVTPAAAVAEKGVAPSQYVCVMPSSPHETVGAAQGPAYASSLAWPAIALALIVLYRSSFEKLLGGLARVKLNTSFGEIELSADDAAGIFRQLLAQVASLSNTDRGVFLLVVRLRELRGAYQLPEFFDRGSKLYGALRALRGCQMVRPINGGMWVSGTFAEIPRFGEYVVTAKRDSLSSGVENGILRLSQSGSAEEIRLELDGLAVAPVL